MSRADVVVALACLAGAGLFIGAGFGFGMLYAGGQIRMQQSHDEREVIEPILASDPAFSGLKCLERSIGGIEVIGTVSTQADHDRLRERIVRAVGEKRADEMVRPVMVGR